MSEEGEIAEDSLYLNTLNYAAYNKEMRVNVWDFGLVEKGKLSKRFEEKSVTGTSFTYIYGIDRELDSVDETVNNDYVWDGKKQTFDNGYFKNPASHQQDRLKKTAEKIKAEVIENEEFIKYDYTVNLDNDIKAYISKNIKGAVFTFCFQRKDSEGRLEHGVFVYYTDLFQVLIWETGFVRNALLSILGLLVLIFIICKCGKIE